MRRAVAALLLASCGSASSPAASLSPAPSPSPAASPSPVAAPAPAPVVGAAPGLPALPFELAMRAPRPADGTAERALIERWASAVGFDLASEPAFTFHALRSDLALFDATPVLELSGHDDGSPRGDGGTLFVLERAGAAGPALRVAIDGGAGPTDPAPGPRPWLLAIAACPDDAALARDDEGQLVLPVACEDLAPTAAATLLARASAASPTDEVRRALTELLRLADPAASIDVVERGADLPSPARRAFRPFVAAVADGTLSAELTVRLGGTCRPLIRYAVLALRATSTTLAVDLSPIGSETLTMRCL